MVCVEHRPGGKNGFPETLKKVMEKGLDVVNLGEFQRCLIP